MTELNSEDLDIEVIVARVLERARAEISVELAEEQLVDIVLKRLREDDVLVQLRREIWQLTREAVEELAKDEYDVGLGVRLDRHPARQNKHDVKLVEVDCLRRRPICRGLCCQLRFVLTAEDIRESILEFDLDSPFRIAHGPDGVCVHFDRKNCTCGVREHRPRKCRTYHCKNDRRIWENYDDMILGKWARARIAAVYGTTD